MSRALKLSLLAAVLLAGPAVAQLVGENLLFAQVPGYVLGQQTKNDDGMMSQLFPSNQTADNWTEMMTVQTYTIQWFVPFDYEATQVKGWLPNCPGLTTQELVNDYENGYSAVTWRLACANNPATGKPENAWFKAIQATNSFFVVGRTFRYVLTADQEAQLMQFMKSVEACDTSTAEHRCPLIENIQPATPPSPPAPAKQQ
jgi:hypothetical protein